MKAASFKSLLNKMQCSLIQNTAQIILNLLRRVNCCSVNSFASSTLSVYKAIVTPLAVLSSDRHCLVFLLWI